MMRKANLDKVEYNKFKRELVDEFMNWFFVDRKHKRDVSKLKESIDKKLREVIKVKEL